MTSKLGAWRSAAPGVVLSGALALIAAFAASEVSSALAKGGASPLSPVLLGVVCGIVWRHFFGIGAGAEQGVQWILRTLLKVGIALIGLRLTLRGISDVGVLALPIVAACIMTALLVSHVVGRMLGLSAGLSQLLAVGSAVCGCTAIMATAPAIRARPLETSTALACVVLIGSVGMLLLPWLAASVFQSQALPVGVFLGSAIHDTSQVIGAALIAAQQFGSPDVVAVASATKLLRNLSIAILVPALAWLSRPRSSSAVEPGVPLQREQLIPEFILWFIVLVMVRALGDQVFGGNVATEPVWLQTMAAAQKLSEVFMLWAMTAVGLSVSLSQIRDAGLRPICAALIVALAVAGCSLGLTYALFDLPGGGPGQ